MFQKQPSVDASDLNESRFSLHLNEIENMKKFLDKQEGGHDKGP
jgi:hypothetical protein